MLVALLADVDAFAAQNDLSVGDSARLAIAVEEVASNALRHGKARCLVIEIGIDADRMELTFEDDGTPFDPTEPMEFKGPNPNSGGGVGLEMVRSWSDSMVYRRQDRTNVLQLRVARTE